MKRALRTSSKFDRKYVKFVRNNPRLQQSIEAALQLLEEDLRTQNWELTR